MHKKKVKNIKIYINPMLPTYYSRKEKEKIKAKEREILSKK